MNKPDWNEYYMSLAFVVAQRSIDPSTKCGCVIVSKDNRILSTGYNGPIKGSDDSKIPLTRPGKYFQFIHAEDNSLLSYGGSYADIQEAKCFVTIKPCHTCLRSLIQKGITEIYYSDLPDAKCVDEDSVKAQELMLEGRNVKITVVPSEKICIILDGTINYLKEKYNG